jgi:hypothetical protein
MDFTVVCNEILTYYFTVTGLPPLFTLGSPKRLSLHNDLHCYLTRVRVRLVNKAYISKKVKVPLTDSKAQRVVEV